MSQRDRGLEEEEKKEEIALCGQSRETGLPPLNKDEKPEITDSGDGPPLNTDEKPKNPVNGDRSPLNKDNKTDESCKIPKAEKSANMYIGDSLPEKSEPAGWDRISKSGGLIKDVGLSESGSSPGVGLSLKGDRGNVRRVGVLPVFYDYVLCTDYPVYVLVGGRGSGKTFFMSQLAAVNLNNKSDYKLMVVEDVETNIGEGVKESIERRRRELGLRSLYSSTKVPPEIKHVNSNSVIFRGYRTPAQQKQVKSLTGVTAAWYEEAQNITYRQFKALRMQLRGGRPEDRQLFLTLNPVNSEGFVSNYFFKVPPSKVFERFPDGRPKVFERNIRVPGEDLLIKCMVIVSTHRDNLFLTRRQRADIEELALQDKNMYDMLALGKFVPGKGAFFPEFTPGLHTCPGFEIPAHWRRYVSFDYGLDMLACYWIALSDGGRRYVYRELYRPGLIISRAAKRIRQATGGEEIYGYIAPPDMWNRRQETGKSAAELFYDNGLYLTKAANDRQAGWLNLKEWMKPTVDEAGNPRAGIVIFDCCENLIRCLSAIRADGQNPNDVDSKSDHELTHGPDAIRYFTAARPAPAPPRPKKPVYNFKSEEPAPMPDMEKIQVI